MNACRHLRPVMIIMERYTSVTDRPALNGLVRGPWPRGERTETQLQRGGDSIWEDIENHFEA